MHCLLFACWPSSLSTTGWPCRLVKAPAFVLQWQRLRLPNKPSAPGSNLLSPEERRIAEARMGASMPASEGAPSEPTNVDKQPILLLHTAKPIPRLRLFPRSLI